MSGSTIWEDRPFYETTTAECVGGPLNGRKLPVQGTYIRGPWQGRYDLSLIGRTQPSGDIAVEYTYEFDERWNSK